MKLLGAVLLARSNLVLAAAPAAAEERISLAKVKRENRGVVRDQCFDTCLSHEVHSCKRVSRLRARCVATVVFTDHAGTTSCRVINRWKRDAQGTEIYSISKRCHPARPTTAG